MNSGFGLAQMSVGSSCILARCRKPGHAVLHLVEVGLDWVRLLRSGLGLGQVGLGLVELGLGQVRLN